MSWSKSFTKESFNNALERSGARDSIIEQNGKEAAQQYDAACHAVDLLIDSGSIGDESKEFHISLSGHANPGHEPKPNYANDMIYINVSQKSDPSPS